MEGAEGFRSYSRQIRMGVRRSETPKHERLLSRPDVPRSIPKNTIRLLYPVARVWRYHVFCFNPACAIRARW